MIVKAVLSILFFLFTLSAEAEVIKTHAVSLTEEIKYGPDFTHFDYTVPDAPKGGEFRRAMYGTFDSFNPFAVKGVAFRASGYMYDTLLEGSLDEAGTYYGLLAQTIEYPDDYSWVIFNLRPEARWHDGKAVTADDVVFSFYKITEVSPFYKNYYELIEKAEALGRSRVKFTFKKGSFSRELPLIAGQLTVIPRHYWEKRDLSKSTLEPPLGSGPYRIGEYEAGKRVVFERVKDYWGENVPCMKGQNNFDRIAFEYFRDQTVAFEAFKAGHFDLTGESSGKRWYRGYEGRYFDMGFIKKEEIRHRNGQGMKGIFMNSAVKPLDDILVRKALNYAYDYDWLNKNIYFGQDRRHDSYFSNSPLASGSVLSPEEAAVVKKAMPDASDELLSRPFAYPSSGGDGNNRANLMKAVSILREAGYEYSGGVMADKNGRPLSLEIIISSKSVEGDLLPFKKALERIGIAFEIKFLDSAQYVERVRNKDYMMIYAMVRQSESPGNEQRGMWSSEAASEKGSRNYSSIKDPAVDRLVDMVINAANVRELTDRVRALDWVLKNGWYVIPAGYSDRWRIAYWDRFGKPDRAPEYSLGFGGWWLDKEKDAKINKAVKR